MSPVVLRELFYSMRNTNRKYISRGNSIYIFVVASIMIIIIQPIPFRPVVNARIFQKTGNFNSYPFDFLQEKNCQINVFSPENVRRNFFAHNICCVHTHLV